MPHGDITHIDIPVSDLAAAARFYGDLFGWDISERPGFEGYPMWMAPNKISGGGLAAREEGFDQPRSYVVVTSIDETLAAIAESGGAVVMPRTPITQDTAFAFFTDPDGNVLGLYEGPDA